jgi:crotonobetainyl-CoA:carnitine CoA-transferase CaiB-like acyl-CoA transferase
MFKTPDGYINIATTVGRIWQLFAETLGEPDLPTRPDYATGPDRSKNRKQLNAEINKLSEKKSSENVGARIQRRGRAVRTDLFDRPAVCGCERAASRRGTGRAQC